MNASVFLLVVFTFCFYKKHLSKSVIVTDTVKFSRTALPFLE